MSMILLAVAVIIAVILVFSVHNALVRHRVRKSISDFEKWENEHHDELMEQFYREEKNNAPDETPEASPYSKSEKERFI